MRVLFLSAVLLLGTSGSAIAQTPDRSDFVRTAATLNEQLVQQIVEAQALTDVDTVNARAAAALVTAQDLEQQLRIALELSTTDNDRSRASGLLDHTLPVIADLERASQETNLSAAHGQLNQAWGEANEALSEILPVAPSAQVVPPTLPNTGNVGGPTIISLPLVAGLLLILSGILLRGRALRYSPVDA
jgi:hypothetical protein